MLPGQLLSGLGVGLILPTLSAVVGTALPARQWGSGSSLINTARQVGAVLGVAVLVAVVGTRTTGAAGDLDRLRGGWVLIALTGAAVVALALGLAAAERRAGRAASGGAAIAELAAGPLDRVPGLVGGRVDGEPVLRGGGGLGAPVLGEDVELDEPVAPIGGRRGGLDEGGGGHAGPPGRLDRV
jgi:hypothetical protein